MSVAAFLSRPDPEPSPAAPCRALLAPLSGVSDVAFRRIAARFGASMVVTEMVPADAYVSGQEEARLRAAGLGVSPHVVQLVGRDPVRMGEAARLAEASGADAIDINFGCPAKRVTGGLAGSALMREPALALRIVESVRASVAVPVSVKMRLGWDAMTLNAPDLAREAARRGASRITVHGRTRSEFYTGSADWAAIATVVAAVDVPVVANGDVASVADARRCLLASRAHAVMIGRAAIGQPWIVGEVAAALAGKAWFEPTFGERVAAALEHYDGLLRLYGTAVGSRHARKHLAAYDDRAREAGWGLAAADRTCLLTSSEPVRVAGLLARIYGEPVRRAA